MTLRDEIAQIIRAKTLADQGELAGIVADAILAKVREVLLSDEAIRAATQEVYDRSGHGSWETLDLRHRENIIMGRRDVITAALDAVIAEKSP